MFEGKIEDVSLRLDLLCLLFPPDRRCRFRLSYAIRVCLCRTSAEDLCRITSVAGHNTFSPQRGVAFTLVHDALLITPRHSHEMARCKLRAKA